MTTSTAAVAQPLDPPHEGDVESPVATLTLTELRERRRRLLEEASRAAHWRRLAQARLDLAVADALAEDLPAPDTLLHASTFRTLLLDGGDDDASDMVVRLRRLDETERSLRAYDTEVRQRLDESTRELVRRYNAEPSACLAAVPRRA